MCLGLKEDEKGEMEQKEYGKSTHRHWNGCKFARNRRCIKYDWNKGYGFFALKRGKRKLNATVCIFRGNSSRSAQKLERVGIFAWGSNIDNKLRQRAPRKKNPAK